MKNENAVREMKMERSTPRLHLSTQDFPEIEKWEVGKKYTLIIELKQVEQHIEEDEVRSTFEITKLKKLPKKKGEFSGGDVKVALSMTKIY